MTIPYEKVEAIFHTIYNSLPGVVLHLVTAWIIMLGNAQSVACRLVQPRAAHVDRFGGIRNSRPLFWYLIRPLEMESGTMRGGKVQQYEWGGM